MVEFQDLPVEIRKKMLNEQVRQGNERDTEVFDVKTSACTDEGGFTWDASVEGHDFWNKIIMIGDFAVFYEKYPKS